MLLAGKKVLVTGGSRGIGEAIVRSMVVHGAKVCFTYISSDEKAIALEAELGKENVLAICCDGKIESSVNESISKAIQFLDGFDILVNNAGITHDNLLLRMNLEQWESVLDNNLTSVFLFTKAIMKFLMRTGGSIINISSVIGLKGNAGQSNYAASKAGIIGFSKSIAIEMGSRNIRCNVIAPGFIETDMTDKLSMETVKSYTEKIPLNRLGSPEEVAKVAVFLASDLSTYVTGQVISVCGGLS